ncbi:dipeptide epimerase [Phormidesmis priestleyi ULC007]|uniref:Dipeptide epimerase n=1 Tax=Phormidesmis priestleyi ULC007 TaxID=1920490 RepID=A0A2T1DDN7_9CYAN|nr:dipeptide epimerase [Phormidesmis priestleyi]PSB18599.1 dipeptide epimerase [Phormidesmis priestleyi ULC007]PZO49753.1 MAG: dipeptide epimerase [Phormidesmis priestleyi]
MQIQIQTFTVHKRFALTISRGTTAQTTNIWVRIEHDGIEGWGEAAPFSVGEKPQTTEAIARSLQAIAPLLKALNPLERQRIDRLMAETRLPSAARAALDVALHDWVGKQANLPLWQLWGLERDRIVPTSVTIGISSPEDAKQRVWDWLGKGTIAAPLQGIQALKIKLGNPDGMEADQAMLLAVKAAAPHISQISVDANGGWNVNTALKMSFWLADQGITYIEQPLLKGQEADLAKLYYQSPLPIFVDESCFTSRDIPLLVDRVHGINIKLLKSGGLSEALRMIHTAKAFGLKVMLGCYSDSSLLNTALAHLSPLADHLDLDSHLNLLDDPFVGAVFQNGRVVPNNQPGLGVRFRN